MLAYGSETWVLSKSDEARIGVFERKVLRAIFGPTNDKGEWKIKYNDELYKLYKESDIYIHQNYSPKVGRTYPTGGPEPCKKSLCCSSRRKKAKGQA